MTQVQRNGNQAHSHSEPHWVGLWTLSRGGKRSCETLYTLQQTVECHLNHFYLFLFSYAASYQLACPLHWQKMVNFITLEKWWNVFLGLHLGLITFKKKGLLEIWKTGSFELHFPYSLKEDNNNNQNGLLGSLNTTLL